MVCALAYRSRTKENRIDERKGNDGREWEEKWTSINVESIKKHSNELKSQKRLLRLFGKSTCC